MNAAKVIKIGYWSNSIMNGAVLNVGGVCKTVMCGAHCGCSPVIPVIMEISKYEEASIRSKQVKGPQG